MAGRPQSVFRFGERHPEQFRRQIYGQYRVRPASAGLWSLEFVKVTWQPSRRYSLSRAASWLLACDRSWESSPLRDVAWVGEKRLTVDPASLILNKFDQSTLLQSQQRGPQAIVRHVQQQANRIHRDLPAGKPVVAVAEVFDDGNDVCLLLRQRWLGGEHALVMVSVPRHDLPGALERRM